MIFDVVYLQKYMVSMVYYGIDVCIMEVFLYVMYFG